MEAPTPTSPGLSRTPLANFEIKKRLLDEYAAGKPIKDLVDRYGVTEGHIYKVAAEAGVKRPRTDPPVTSAPISSDEAPAPPAAPRAGPVTTIVAPPAGGVCPLFPSTKTNQVDHLMVRRVICEPPHESARYGVGVVLDHADPGLSETDLKLSYGGGRYEIKAMNGRGEILVTRIVRVNGVKSKPIDAYDTAPAEDGANAVFLPGAPGGGASSIGVFSNMMTQVLERMDRRDDAINQRFDRMTDERQREQSQMRETELRLITEHHRASMEIMREAMAGGKKDSGSPLDQLTQMMTIFKTMKDFAGDAHDENGDPVSAAISAAPDIIGNLAALIHGGKTEPVLAAPARVEPSPPPPAASTFQSFQPGARPDGARVGVEARAGAGGVGSYDAIAKALLGKLIADGVPEADAKRMVVQGFTLLDAQIKPYKSPESLPAPPPNGSGRPIPAILPHPAPISTNTPTRVTTGRAQG